MATNKELSDFLQHIEKNAFKRAMYSVNNSESALDIVQDSMLKLIEKYSDKPEQELLFLFQKILTNNINDWFRQKNKSIVQSISDFDLDDDTSFLETLESNTETPFDLKNRKDILSEIENSIKTLPERQKEAFILRYVEEFTIEETAKIMNCSDGSVKTHCSRAVATLSKYLLNKNIFLSNL